MNSFRQINRRTLLLWVFLLSLALLCAQGVKLHVHNLDHGHDNHHNDYHSHTHDGIDEVADHEHLSKAHFTHDTSHSDHHNGVASEIDVAPDGLLKSSNNNIFSIALFTLFFALIIFISSRQPVQHYRKNKLALHNRRYVLSPPLRAPPLL